MVSLQLNLGLNTTPQNAYITLKEHNELLEAKYYNKNRAE